MAEPARKIYDDDSDGQPVTRPKLQALEGGGQTSAPKSGHLRSVDRRASPNQLDKAESSGDKNSINFDPDDNDTGHLSKARNFFGGSKRRKRSTAGGIITAIIFGGGFGFLSIASGPGQFVSMATFMTRTHFAPIQNQSDVRFGTILAKYRVYQALKGTAGWERTRMGFLGNHYSENFQNDLADKGITLDTSNNGYSLDRIRINPLKNPELKGMSSIDARKHVQKELNLKDFPGVDKNTGDIIIQNDINGRFANHSFFRGIVQLSGKGRIAGSIGGRLLIKSYNVSFHNITRDLSRKKGETIEKWRKRLFEKDKSYINSGSDEAVKQNVEIACGKDQSSEQCKEAQDKAKQITDAEQKLATQSQAAEEGAVLGDATEADKLNGSLTKNLGLTKGNVLTAVGIGALCGLEKINQDWNNVKKAKVIAPLIRMAVEFISYGEQVKNGSKDLDAGALGEKTTNQLYDDSNSKSDPYAQTSWTDSTLVRQQMLKDGYTDIPQTTQGTVPPDSALSGIMKSSPFDFLNKIPGLGATCSFLGNKFVSVIGTLIGLFNPAAFVANLGLGEGINFAVSMVAKGVALTPVVAHSVGAETGSYVMVGGRLAANAQTIAEAGGSMSTAATNQLQQDENNIEHNQFADSSLSNRLFNLSEPRSFASQIMMLQHPGLLNNTTHIASSLSGILQSVIKLPATILGSSVYADSNQNVDYGGIPAYGFSDQEMQEVGDPQSNSLTASGLLDTPCTKWVLTDKGWEEEKNHPCQADYQAKVSTCFGDSAVDMGKVSGARDMVKYTGQTLTIDEFVWPSAPDGPYIMAHHEWDVQVGSTPVDAYNGKYPKVDGNFNGLSNNCSNDNSNWLSIRFFIFDTLTMKSMVCYEGDDTSCSEMGFPGSSTSSN